MVTKSNLAWLSDYLTNRTQRTCFGENTSKRAKVETGVPQGSVLGPLLFVYYINSLTQCVGEHVSVIMYADDIALYTSHKKLEKIEERLQTTLNAVADWCDAAKLTINAKKSKCVLYASCSRSPLSGPLAVSLGGIALERVPVYTYLGIPLDSKLTFEHAIGELTRKVNNRLFNLAKIRNLIDRGTALVIYRTSVATLFDYASFFYVAGSDTGLQKLQRLQNRGLRTCLNTANHVYHVDELHSMSGTSMLERRWDELLLTLMLKFYKAEYPEGGPDHDVSSLADRSLRSDSKMLFSMRRPITQGYKKSPAYRGRMLWNVQPEDLKQSISKAQFKRKLKTVVDFREKYPSRQ